MKGTYINLENKQLIVKEGYEVVQTAIAQSTDGMIELTIEETETIEIETGSGIIHDKEFTKESLITLMISSINFFRTTKI